MLEWRWSCVCVCSWLAVTFWVCPSHSEAPASHPLTQHTSALYCKSCSLLKVNHQLSSPFVRLVSSQRNTADLDSPPRCVWKLALSSERHGDIFMPEWAVTWRCRITAALETSNKLLLLKSSPKRVFCASSHVEDKTRGLLTLAVGCNWNVLVNAGQKVIGLSREILVTSSSCCCVLTSLFLLLQNPDMLTRKIKLCHINAHITCRLCEGYLIDATTVTECLHTCRSPPDTHTHTQLCCLYLTCWLAGRFSESFNEQQLKMNIITNLMFYWGCKPA